VMPTSKIPANHRNKPFHRIVNQWRAILV
jgi:hypothetical protein